MTPKKTIREALQYISTADLVGLNGVHHRAKEAITLLDSVILIKKEDVPVNPYKILPIINGEYAEECAKLIQAAMEEDE